MKLATAILFLFVVQANANAYAQKISISVIDSKLTEVLETISKQSGYDYIANDKLLKYSFPVTITTKNKEIEVVLKQILDVQNLTFKLENKTILISKKENSIIKKIFNNFFLNIDVRGKITNENGDLLVGAVIRLKGTNKQTTSTENGSFFLSDVPEKSIVEISYVGYETAEVDTKQEIGTIVLKLKVSKLDEVTVSTGYQSILKERAPGAFGSVSSETLEKRPVLNLSTALQGMVAGMQGKENADGSVQFLIRGNSSIYADRRPLIVVDGFPINESDFSSINPNDVENITVLKDAAAASIWGARSGNGVIVITTKKSRRTSGINIEGSAFTRISAETDLDQLLNNASSSEQVAYEQLAYNKGWFFNKYAGAFTDVSKPLTLAQELLFANTGGKITNDQLNFSLDSLSKINNKDQINKLLLRRAIQQQYNVNFSAGTEKSKTYASLLFENNETRYRGSENKRFALNVNNDYKFTNFLSFNFGLNLQYRNGESGGTTISELQQLSPYETLLNPNGSYSVNLNGKNREQLALIPLEKFPYSDWSYNLLREVNGRSFENEDISARIQAGLHLKILKGLSFDTKIQYEKRKAEYINYYSDDTYFTRDLVNTYVEYNNTTKVVGRKFLPNGGLGTYRNTDQKSYVFRNQLNYIRDLSNKHSINAIAGMEISQNRLDTRNNPWQYGYDKEKLLSTVPVYGYGSTVDLFTNFQGQNVTLPGGNTTLGYNIDRYVSFYANAAYTYDAKYTLSASIRSDASNFITDNPLLRWSPLWSVGTLWNLKKEQFLMDKGFISRLNLRLTYGRNGNVEKSSSTQAIINVSTAPSTTTGTITATISDYGNPTLRWEKTETTNLGLDFAFLGEKITGKLDLYNKIGKDITGFIALPAAVGTTSQRFNNAGIKNRGIEIELGTRLVAPSISLIYTTAFNYAYNDNKISSLYSPITLTAGYLDANSAYVEGRPINPVYSFTYGGSLAGVPQIIGPNGLPSSFNTTAAYASNQALSFLNYEGTLTPPHTLGWLNAFQVKDFSVSLLLIGKMGGVYRNNAFNYSAYVGSNKTYVNGQVGEVFEGREDLPGFANANEANIYLWDRYATYLSGLIESSSYIEAKELMVDYSLSKKVASKIGSRSIRIFAQARDLGVIWASNRKGYNPDWLPGTDRPLQTYTFGLNIKF